MAPRGVIRSAAVVGFCTLLSRLLGLVRQMLMGALFGTGLAHSAFVVAFRIPNLLRRLFGEGALSAGLIPVYAESMKRDGRESADELAARIMVLVSGFLIVVVGIGMLLATLALMYLPLGPKAAAVLPLLRIMFPYGFLICLVAICMGVLNTFHHFTIPAITPVLLNLVWIFVLVVVCPLVGASSFARIEAVAWGVLAAGCLQLLVQVPALRRHGFKPRFSLRIWHDKRVMQVLRLMGPVAVGMGAYQVNVMVDGILALWVAPWAPAALFCAEMVVYLPLGVFGTSIGTVLLPTFSHQVVASNTDEIRTTLFRAVRTLLFLALPASVALVILAQPVTQLLYERQAFDAVSTVRSARAMAFYAPGILFFALNKALVPVFYALQQPWIPMRIGLGMVALNFVLNIVFILTWPEGYQHAGLAFATSYCAFVETVVLCRVLGGRISSAGIGSVVVSAVKAVVLTSVMGILVGGCHHFLAVNLLSFGKWGQVGAMSMTVVVGVVFYFSAGWLLCRDEYRSIVTRRLRRGKACTNGQADSAPGDQDMN